MKFSVQLSCDYPDPAYGGKQLYADMIEQALLAARLGFDAVSITEPHLINLLMMPAPLQFAVKIAGVTKRVKIILGVAVLPLGVIVLRGTLDSASPGAIVLPSILATMAWAKENPSTLPEDAPLGIPEDVETRLLESLAG